VAGVDEVVLRIEQLVAGEVAGATYPVPPGRFVQAPPYEQLEALQESAATKRPFTVEVEGSVDELEESGIENVTGNLVDSTHSIVLRVAYFAGADARALVREQVQDWRRLRRCLVHPDNYDEDTTGLMTITMGRAEYGRPRPERGQGRVSVLTIPLVAQVREDWTQEP
jgi:hypothetical protein